MTCSIAALLTLSIHAIPGDYNAIHPGAVVQCDRFIAGAYYNSEYNMSAFAGVEIPITNRFNIEAGLVTGYEDQAVLPSARFTYEVTDDFRWFATPIMTSGNLGAVFGLELRIGRNL